MRLPPCTTATASGCLAASSVKSSWTSAPPAPWSAGGLPVLHSASSCARSPGLRIGRSAARRAGSATAAARSVSKARGGRGPERLDRRGERETGGGRREAVAPRLREERGEARGGREIGPQHEQIDKVAHHVSEALAAAPRRRRADQKLALAAETVEQ